MPLSPEQRAAINKQNAQNSTGPTSEQGKANSRRNALKHGLRAEALPLPGEDPAVAAARAEAWNDYYQPQSPAAQHLVNTCVRATLLSDRCDQYQHTLISKQVREAEKTWDDARADTIAHQVSMLNTDPAAAVRHLKRTGDGCSWMIGRWMFLREALQARGHWSDDQCYEAVRLLGLSPENATLKQNPGAWMTRFLNVVSRPDPSPALVRWYCDPKCQPESTLNSCRVDSYPDPDDCRQSLLDMIAEEMKPLEEAESRLYDEYDGPARSDAAALALMPTDEANARLFLRYQAESRTSFHRAYGTLVKTLAQDAAEADSPNEANAEAGESPNEANAEAESPNEANPEPVTQQPSGPANPPISPAADDFAATTAADKAPMTLRGAA